MADPDVRDVGEGVFDPAGYIVRGGLKVLKGVFAGGPKGPSDYQKQVLIDAGYTKSRGPGGKKAAVLWTSPTGQVIGNITAREVARAIVRAPVAAAPVLPVAPAAPVYTPPIIPSSPGVSTLPPPTPPASVPSVVDELPPWLGPAVVGGGAAGAVGAALPRAAAWLYAQWPKVAKRLRKSKRAKKAAVRAAVMVGRELLDRARAPVKTTKARRATAELFRRSGVLTKRPALLPRVVKVIARSPATWVLLPSVIGRESPVTRADILRRFPTAPAQRGPRSRASVGRASNTRPTSILPPPVIARAPITKRTVPATGGLRASTAPVPKRARGAASSSRVFGPAATPSSAPTTSSVPRSALLLGAASLLLPGRARRRDPLSISAPVFGVTPATSSGGLTGGYSTGLRSATCECPPKRKSSRKACRNPVVSKRKSTRGGRRFETITRRLECPASSRKRPQ